MLYQNQRPARKAAPGASDTDELSPKAQLRAECQSPDAALLVTRFIERRYQLNPIRARLVAELAFKVGPRR